MINLLLKFIEIDRLFDKLKYFYRKNNAIFVQLLKLFKGQINIYSSKKTKRQQGKIYIRGINVQCSKCTISTVDQ